MHFTSIALPLVCLASRLGVTLAQSVLWMLILHGAKAPYAYVRSNTGDGPLGIPQNQIPSSCAAGCGILSTLRYCNNDQTCMCTEDNASSLNTCMNCVGSNGFISEEELQQRVDSYVNDCNNAGKQIPNIVVDDKAPAAEAASSENGGGDASSASRTTLGFSALVVAAGVVLSTW
uniref:Extracellular membrane protein CFEM domain-containing protein n=1 Tax=Moniliophthora roreri TaxID=221103 RepID=A0A0W0EXC8_MONRR